MVRPWFSLVLSLSVFAGGLAPAYGLPVFRKEFGIYYGLEEPETEVQKQLALAFDEIGCLLCHMSEDEPELRNPYGMALSEYLDHENYTARRIRAEPEETSTEIREALKKAEDVKGPNGKTFGELIRAGVLPVEPAE